MFLHSQTKGDRQKLTQDRRALAAASLDETLNVMLLLWLTKQPRSLADIEAAFGLEPCSIVGAMARLIRAELLGISRSWDMRSRPERRFYTRTHAFKRAIAEHRIELSGEDATRAWRSNFAMGHSVAAQVALATAEGAISADDC